MASCRASRLSSKLYRVTSMATTRGLLPHSLAPTSDGDVHDEPSEGPGNSKQNAVCLARFEGAKVRARTEPRART
jgi:hypothetical protein